MDMILSGPDTRRKIVKDVRCPECDCLVGTVTKPKYNAGYGIFECPHCGMTDRVDFIYQRGNPITMDARHWNHGGGLNK